MVPGHFQQQQSQQSIHNRNSDNNRQHYQTITMAAMFKLGLGGGGGGEEGQYYGDFPLLSRAHSSDGGDAHIDGNSNRYAVLASTNDRCIGWKRAHAIYLCYTTKILHITPPPPLATKALRL